MLEKVRRQEGGSSSGLASSQGQPGASGARPLSHNSNHSNNGKGGSKGGKPAEEEKPKQWSMQDFKARSTATKKVKAEGENVKVNLLVACARGECVPAREHLL